MALPQVDPRDGVVGTPPAPAVGQKKDGPGAAILLVLAPLLCCGGPLILGVLATASAATLGTLGAVVGVVLLAGAAAVWARRRRRAGMGCCPPAGGAWRQ